MKPSPSQGRRLIALLKRVAECLAPHELLLKSTNARGLVVWRVRSATKWTA